MGKYTVKGSYTYKVFKAIYADTEEEALEIATNHSEPMCEWASQFQDTYSEQVTSIKEIDPKEDKDCHG